MKKTFLFFCTMIITYNLSASDINLDGKIIQLKSLSSGNCIQVEGNVDEDGAKIIQYPCDESEKQKITFSKEDENYYTISLSNSKKLAIASNSKSNGVNVVQDLNGSQFKIIKKKNGFSLQLKHSEKFMSTTSYNTDIVQAGMDNLSNQNWIIHSNVKSFASCKEIFDAGKSTGDGIYTLDTEKDGSKESFEAYCDMTTDGGGWTRLKYDTSAPLYKSDTLPYWSRHLTYSSITEETITIQKNSEWGASFGVQIDNRYLKLLKDANKYLTKNVDGSPITPFDCNTNGLLFAESIFDKENGIVGINANGSAHHCNNQPIGYNQRFTGELYVK